LKVSERKRSRDFKKRRRMIPTGDQIADRGQRRSHIFFADHLAVDLNPLPKRDQVRRRKQASLQTRLAADRVEHRAHRSLAVGSGDVDEFQPGRIDAECTDQAPRIFQSQFDAVKLCAVEPLDGLPEIHGVGFK
jgi:hypothetical protein